MSSALDPLPPADGVWGARVALTGPLVPSIRAGAPGSEAPKSTSGSSSSLDAMRVGTMAESGRASIVGCASALRSSSAPGASRSSSESIVPFAAAADGAAAVAEGRAAPACTPVPSPANDSSTGKSVKGSKVGREAASIVFEPELGNLSWAYPAVPPSEHLGDGSQIGGAAPGS
jgi:hypothetical protein